MALQRRSRVDGATRAARRGELAAVVVGRRQELDLSQAELADLAGVSVRFVHSLEAGRTEVGLARLLVVLETLGLHLEVGRGVRAGVVVDEELAVRLGLGRNSR